MKQNFSYTAEVKRVNFIKVLIFRYFFPLAVFFRVPLEIFFRKEMGHRYYSAPFTLVIGLLLFLVPFYVVGNGHPFYALNHLSDLNWSEFLKAFSTWFIFLGFFAYFGFKRWKELENGPSPFDGERLTTSSGYMEDYYAKFIPKYLLQNPRRCDIYGEPFPFLIAGLVLSYFGQAIGVLMILCSIIYCLSYLGAYFSGDDYLMEIIDNEVLGDNGIAAFMDDENVANRHGIQFYMKRPSSEELRRKFAQKMFNDEDDNEPPVMQ